MAACASVARGYSILTNDAGWPVKWTSTTIVMKIEVDNTVTLFDGLTRATSIQAAMTGMGLVPVSGWNSSLGTVQFYPLILGIGTGGEGNQSNEIFFSGSPYDQSWDANTLAVTISWISGDERRESDIIFNTGYTWDSYRGPLRTGSYDIQRVALHELGHVLGLDHPDEHGQTVDAVMNSMISNTYSLTADDIAGVQSLYGAPGVTPGNDNFANATTITLSGNSAQLSGTSVGATKEPGEPGHANEPGGHSVWWNWTATSNGTVTVDTAGSNFDTLLGVYTGTLVSALTTVASNDDVDPGVIRTSALTFAATSGTTYYIAVDGWGADSGSVVLNLNFVQPTPPSITGQPASQTVFAGSNVQFSVSASGTPTLTFQWQRLPAGGATWSNLSDAGAYSATATATLSVSAVTTVMSGDQFRCVVTNGAGSATSSAAVLTVSAPVPPSIAGQPANQTVMVGSDALFSVSASGTSPVTFQWQRLPAGGGSWSNLGDGGAYYGTTTTVLRIGAVTLGMSGDQFRCVATNSAGSATSSAATLTVNAPVPPVISDLPAAILLNLGDQLLINCVATGTAPITYQWYKDGAALPGATGSTYSKSSVVASDAGLYTVKATNAGGSTTSTGVVVSIAGPSNAGVIAVAAANSTSFFIRSDGTLWGTGNNYAGQLGSGNTMDRATPLRIATGVVSVSAGSTSTLFVKPDGTLWATGGNSFGQLGDGTTTIRLSPVQIAVGVVAASAGAYHSLFLKSDGTLWGMGGNQCGELGDGTTTQRSTPIQIASSVVTFAAGDYFTLFVKSDGTLWAMGADDVGQLGNGTRTNSVKTPVQVATGVTAVSAGSMHSLLLKADGTLWGMGDDRFGELGLPMWAGYYSYYSSPTQIDTGVALASAGDSHTLYVKSDATLWSVGDNNYGELGRGFLYMTYSTPGQSATGVATTAAGASFSLYADTAGTLWGLGRNDLGVLGDGTIVTRYNPVQIASGTITIPIAPIGVTSSRDATSGGVLLSWNPTIGAAWYEVWRGASDNPATATRIAGKVPIALFYDLAANPGDNHYWVKAVNPAGASASSISTLITVNTAPDITAAPVDQTVITGGTAAFTVAAGGSPSPSCQWQVSTDGSTWIDVIDGGTNPAYSGATTGTLTITGPTLVMDGWQFRCIATNGVGSATSNAATLTVNELPAFTMPPSAQSVTAGDGTSFAAAASGAPAPAFHWQVSTDNGSTSSNVTDGGTNPTYSGATTAKLTITGTTPAMNGWQYRCVAGNAAGDATSDAATLTVNWAPVITVQPFTRGVFEGQGVDFTVAANGNPAPDYQWQVSTDGGNNWDAVSDGGSSPGYSGATGATLTVTGTAAAVNGWWYRCVANNSIGSTTSGAAQLIIRAPGSHLPSADFNGDGRTDILWRNTLSGDAGVWLMDGTAVTGYFPIGTVSTAWQIAGTGDFNGDGQTDILWRNTLSGDVGVWLMDGTTVTGYFPIGTVSTAWQIAGSG